MREPCSPGEERGQTGGTGRSSKTEREKQERKVEKAESEWMGENNCRGLPREAAINACHYGSVSEDKDRTMIKDSEREGGRGGRGGAGLGCMCVCGGGGREYR